MRRGRANASKPTISSSHGLPNNSCPSLNAMRKRFSIISRVSIPSVEECGVDNSARSSLIVNNGLGKGAYAAVINPSIFRETSISENLKKKYTRSELEVKIVFILIQYYLKTIMHFRNTINYFKCLLWTIRMLLVMKN